MLIFIIYLIFISIFSLAIMYTDKTHAKYRLWRISESLIFLVSILGGSLGVYLGMYLFHHKTRKKIFSIGIPLIILIQIIILILLYRYIPHMNQLINIL